MAYWTVAQTESQRESVAAKFLKERGYETYLPLIANTKENILRRRDSVVPLFPTYIFIRIENRWYSARWTPAVLRLLMVDERPAMVADKEVEKIRKSEGRDGLVKLPKPPKQGHQKGDPVEFYGASPFAGKLGIHDGMSGTERTQVLLNLMGRAVRVSAPNSEIRPVGTKSDSCA